ncbi:hypothetical protein Slin14017_G010100 [Septoria linicola]|nr:hypothetical protein Slin14017_G010100 [Septoria linicola]
MYPTPPRTVQKSGIFHKRTTKPHYYEDVLGARNPEETYEGTAEKCESDSDSDSSIREAFKKSPEYQRQYGSYSRKAQARVTGTPSSTVMLLTDDESGSGEEESYDGGEEETGDGAIVVIDLEDDVTHKDGGYQIVPNLNSKRSVPRSQVRKLKAKKFGLFSKNNGLSEDESDVVPTIEGDDCEAFEDGGEELSSAPSSRSRHRQAIVVPRSADRIPIKQQMAELVASRIRAEKAAKKALRVKEAADKAAARAAKEQNSQRRRVSRTNLATQSKTASKQKLTSRIVGSKSSKPAAHTKKLRTAHVVLDNSGIDLSEYTRYA